MLIEADRLIDGVGDAPRRPGRIWVSGDRIAAVGEMPVSGLPLAGSTACAVALPGCTLLPGLIDFHSHLGIDTRHGRLQSQVQVSVPEYIGRGIARAQEDLRGGVTTMRLCGDRHGVDLILRREIEAGRVVAPRLLVAGRAIRSPRASGGAVASVFTDDPAAIERAVEENLEAGADFIKLFVSDGVGDPAIDPTMCYYGEAHVSVAARRAHAVGRPVAAHLLGGPGVAPAIGGGLDVLEHGWFLTDSDLDLIGRYDVLLTLTLGVLCGSRGRAFHETGDESRLAALSRAAQETARKVIARRLRYVVGTDALHGCLADELGWLVTLGETPMRAIRAATAWPAAALGLERTVGTLEPGKVADVIAVEGDPLEEIEAMTRIRLVMSRGRVVYLNQPGECR